MSDKNEALLCWHLARSCWKRAKDQCHRSGGKVSIVAAPAKGADLFKRRELLSRLTCAQTIKRATPGRSGFASK